MIPSGHVNKKNLRGEGFLQHLDLLGLFGGLSRPELHFELVQLHPNHLVTKWAGNGNPVQRNLNTAPPATKSRGCTWIDHARVRPAELLMAIEERAVAAARHIDRLHEVLVVGKSAAQTPTFPCGIASTKSFAESYSVWKSNGVIAQMCIRSWTRTMVCGTS
jgi:hypothetical protein